MIASVWYQLVSNLVLWTSATEAAHILSLWPMPSHSHYAVGRKLMMELATRGHNVTMISPFNSQENMKNYRNIYLEDAIPQIHEKFGPEFDFFNLEQLPSYDAAFMFSHFGFTFNQILLQNRKVQDLLNNNETFDLVIVDMVYTESLWGFSHHYNCPLVVVNTFVIQDNFVILDGTHLINFLVGNPAPNSYVPDFYLHFTGHMNFFERLQNLKHSLIIHLYRYLYQLPQLNQQLHEFFPTAPQLEELLYNRTALILLNTHPSIQDPKPQVPSIIEVGGLHLNEPKHLPLDLQQFMDNATDGVIFFSMGSNLKSRNLSNDTRSAILRAFAKVRQQIIWKWEDEKLPEKPGNVRIMKWCPQNDILAHPNLKLFITHGGLLSVTEAVYFGVPLLILPIFGDQKMNMAIATRKQFGIGIYQDDLSENTLSTALNELLQNPMYHENAKIRSKLLRDRPVKPLDAAVYWTEYVMKYKGATHLRTAAMDLEWYQLYSIDLALFLLLIAVSVFLIIHHIIKRILRRVKIADGKKKN